MLDLRGSDKISDMPRKPSPFNQAVGRRLAILRGESTKRDIAQALGVLEDTYSSWELGKNGLPVDMAVKLADGLGLTLDWLYRGRTEGLSSARIQELRKAERLLRAA